jgi:hypothetical protein
MKAIILLTIIFSFSALASKELYKKYKPAVVKLSVIKSGKEVSGGTGFFLGPNGIIVTNAHVVEGGITANSSLEVKTADGKKLSNLQFNECLNKDLDLCFIKTNYKPSSYFNPKVMDFELGEKIFVIGHSLGLDYTISDGLVSGKRDYKDINKKVKSSISLFQISAPISPGNSGGPAFDGNGNLVGVSTFIYGSKKLGGQNLNFTISNKEVVKRYNELSKIKFLTFNEYVKKVTSGAYDQLNGLVALYHKLLKQMRKEKKKFKTKPMLALMSKTSNFAVTAYFPEKFMKCKGHMGVYLCKADLLTSFTYMISNKARFNEFLKELKKKEGQFNSAYKAAQKLKDNKELQEIIVKRKNSFIQKYKSLGCRNIKGAFNNTKDSTTVCKHLFKNISMPGNSILISEVQVDKDNYVTLVSEYGNSKLEKLADAYTEMAMAFTEVGYLKANNKVSKAQKSQQRKQRREDRNKVYKTSLEGIVTDTYYTRSSGKIKVVIKVDDVAEYSFRLKINPNDYLQPKILLGDTIKIEFEDKVRRIEMGLRTKRFSPDFFKITNKTPRSVKNYEYEVRYAYIRDDYVSVSFKKDGESISAKFVAGAFEEFKKLNIQKGDLVRVNLPDIISFKSLTFIKPGQIKVIGTASKGIKIASPSVYPSIRKKSPSRSARRNSRKNEPMRMKGFSGTITKLSYLRSSDKISLKLDSSDGEIKFSLKNSGGKLAALPPIALGDQVEIRVNLEPRDFERKMNNKYFILDPEEYTISAKKTAYSDSFKISGRVSYAKDYDDRYYFSMKNKDGRRITVDVTHPKGVKVLRQINFKKGDFVTFGAPDYIEKSNRYEYVYSFEIHDHQSN